MILKACERIAAMFGAVTTTRSMAAEFGPTPATLYPQLATMSDDILVRESRHNVLAAARALDEAQFRAASHGAAVRG